jgi:hypothetical protein
LIRGVPIGGGIPLNKLSISQIFLNKKRRNLKKGKRLIGIVLKEGIKVEVSKKMEKWAAQELQYADLGDTRRKKRLISIVENLASQLSTSVP